MVLAGAVLFFGYAYRFNLLVTEQFQGRPWELPARVYARSMDIYKGQPLSADNLEKELQLMGYRKIDTTSLSNPGTYNRREGVFDLFCRSFDFGDVSKDLARVPASIGFQHETHHQDRVTLFSILI